MKLKRHQKIHHKLLIVLKDGQLLGGDSAFAFVGSYTVSGDTLKAKIHVSKHSNMLQNIFGIDEFDLNLSGKVDAHRISLSGSPSVMPQATLNVTCTRKADLH